MNNRAEEFSHDFTLKYDNVCRYFVVFPNDKEKQEFADTFVGAAMNNWKSPFLSLTGDGLNIAIIMVDKRCVDFWKKKHPTIQFVETKWLEASWGDDY
jgi:hypothetical protein